MRRGKSGRLAADTCTKMAMSTSGGAAAAAPVTSAGGGGGAGGGGRGRAGKGGDNHVSHRCTVLHDATMQLASYRVWCKGSPRGQIRNSLNKQRGTTFV